MSERSDPVFVLILNVVTDAEDFTPLPPVLAKEEVKVKSQWDDEDVEEEPKEEEKPKPVRYLPDLCFKCVTDEGNSGITDSFP